MRTQSNYVYITLKTGHFSPGASAPIIKYAGMQATEALA